MSYMELAGPDTELPTRRRRLPKSGDRIELTEEFQNGRGNLMFFAGEKGWVVKQNPCKQNAEVVMDGKSEQITVANDRMKIIGAD